MPTLATDSYATAAEYEAYASARGISVNHGQLDHDLVKSADFIDTHYNFKGEPLDEAQPMKLPTDLVTIANIKKAALKAVEMQQAGLLTLDLAALAGGVVKREMKKADVLEKEVEYQDNTTPTSKPRTPELDQLLRPYLAGGDFGKLRV